MKKSTKILSLLMALVMIFSLTTVAMADSSDVKLGSDKNNITLEWGTPNDYSQGLAPAYDVAYKAVGETGIYQRLPVYGNQTVKYNPANWAIPETGSVKVSEDGIIDNFSFTLDSWKGTPYTGYTGLQFNYTAVKAGTVTVTVTYYYKFSPSGWYGETATFKVVVSDGEVDPPNKPDKPTVSDVENFYGRVNTTSSSVGAVYMWCDTTYDHHAWFSCLTDVEDGYTLGEVVANDGSKTNFPVNRYPWMCKMTVYADKYMEAYNEQMEVKHYLETPGSTETVKWFWNANTGWDYAYSGPVYFNITHTAPTPPVTEYTVTYTDGVDGAAFADQTYTVKDGEATPAFDGTPEREGYVFLGWEPEVAETVTGNATYTAKWEEALTEVKVTSNKKEGSLLFLGDELKVTVKTNVKADSITITPTLNGALKQVASSTADDGTKTIWYRVTKIIGDYTKLSFTATATKGNQPSVTDTLTFGVNLRNRIHVVVDQEPSNVAVVDASLRLMHKYPQWNACPSLKFDAAKGEYVMKNAWDLSNQEFTQLEIKVGDKTYYVDKTKDGENLFDVIRDGTKEIYVNYTIVAPIKVTVVVNGETVTKEFDGNKGDVLNYGEWSNTIVMNALTGKTLVGLTTTGLNAKNQAVFGETTEVVINVVVADNN